VRPWSLLLVALVALPLIVGVAGLPRHDAPDSPIHTHVGTRYLERGVAETGFKNMVTAVLLNYRGFDTFVEVVVIFTALAAVLALPRGEAADPDHAPGQRAPADDATGAPEPGDDAVATAAVPATSGPRDGSETGRAHEVVPVSPVVLFVVRILAPFLSMFALAMLFRGHITPGGGFQAAAVFGAVFIALGLVFGLGRVARLVPTGLQPWLQAAGPLAFVFVAWFGWRLTGFFLGFPIDDHTTQEGMGFVLEVAIGVGGGVILARLFLSMEA